MALTKRRRENGETPVDEAEKKQKVEVAGGSGYVNRQRVLVFSSRGITTRYRHLMDDFRKLLPHHKREVKVNNCIYQWMLNKKYSYFCMNCSWMQKIHYMLSMKLRKSKDVTLQSFWKHASVKTCTCGLVV